MSNKDVAIRFATTNKTNGKSTNMFIDGNTIYSYGYHFPIATKTNTVYKGKRIVLFNDDTYSRSTQQHQSYTHWELYQAGFEIVKVNTLIIKCFQYSVYINPQLERNGILFYAKHVSYYMDKMKRARKQSMKDIHLNTAKEYQQSAKVFEYLLANYK